MRPSDSLHRFPHARFANKYSALFLPGCDAIKQTRIGVSFSMLRKPLKIDVSRAPTTSPPRAYISGFTVTLKEATDARTTRPKHLGRSLVRLC
jgi:hypothetical protein